jgi:hypothetical protein
MGEYAPMPETTVARLSRRLRRTRPFLLATATLAAAVATGAVVDGPPPASAATPAPSVAQAGIGIVPASLPARVSPAVGRAATRAGEQIDRLLELAPGLDREVLGLALAARDSVRARGLAGRPELLTVIDYSKPSTEERLWVLDLEREELLFHELVAHGKNTGDKMARHFSNRNESRQSSLGVFVTGETYHGGNGYSLRLRGLEPGVNDLAMPRAIVMHGAPYVSREFAQRHGRIGRSWGCPAVSQQVAREMIDTLKGGSVVFSYFPDQQWLGGSAFLGGAVRAAE